ncbi:MAG: alpha/beta hydrolase [Solobacterium sp.]|nr:alpha/beta hydrolase [Solobacterium sp.]
MKKIPRELYICALTGATCAFLSLLLPAHIRACLFCAMLCFAAYIIFAVYRKKEYLRYRIAAAAAVMVCALLYILFPSVLSLYAFRITATAVYITETYALLKDTADVWKKTFLDDKMTYLFRIVLACALLFAGCMLAVWEVYPQKFLAHMETMPFEEGHNDRYAGRYPVQYGIPYQSTYPEGTFDLILPEGETAGTVIWVHGGGHMPQDKYTGLNRTLITNMLEEGYAAVLTDYTAAAVYPSMNVQLEELISFLRENSSSLGINASHFILAGTDCGADTVLQYVMSACVPAYAEKNGLSASLAPSDIICVYLCSAMYRPQYGAGTDLILSDYTAAAQLRRYYEVIDLQSSSRLKDLDVIPYVCGSLPPVFFSEGNTGTYTVQAHAFEDALKQTDVIYEAHIFDSVRDKRELVYMSFDCQNNHFASAVNGAFLAFLRDIQKP